jgi:hypothetical protein
MSTDARIKLINGIPTSVDTSDNLESFVTDTDAVVVGDAVYQVSGVDSKVAKADADDGTKIPPVGVVTTLTSATECVVVTPGGIATDLSGLTRGTVYWLSSTAGALVSTRPGTNAWIVGVAVSATSLLVMCLPGDMTSPAFCGLVSKDYNPPNQSWAVGYTVGATYDAGIHGILVPEMTSNPGKIGNVSSVIVYMFHDGTELLDENTGAGAQYRAGQGILELILGNDVQTATNNGKVIRKIEIRIRNVAGGPETQDLGICRVRATAYPRGGGASL